MVNGRTLEEELNRIDGFFAAIDLEQFEKMAFECGAGEIRPSDESVYVRAVPKRYANVEAVRKSRYDSVFNMTDRETGAA